MSKNKINIYLYHLKRLWVMFRERGFFYTLNYLSILAVYFTNILHKGFWVRLFHKFRFYPRYIEVEPTTFCNFRCKMCELAYWKEKSQNMGLPDFKKIIDQFPKLWGMDITGIGSGFLNPDFLKMIAYVKKKNKNTYLGFNDPFFFIDKKAAEKLIDLGVDRITMSIDGATKKTYENIRIGSNWEQVIKNVKDFIALKKKKGTHFPELTFEYVILKENKDEVIPFIRLVKKLTKGETTHILFTTALHVFDEIKDIATGVSNEFIEKTLEEGEKQGVRVIWSTINRPKLHISQCLEWAMPFIFVDGTVTVCCAGNEANDRGYQRKASLGNILKEDYRKIWYGPKYEALRKAILAGKVPPACRGCPRYELC